MLRRLLCVLAVVASVAGSGTAWAAVTGPDVSSWNHPQGAAIDWSAVQKSGSSFAFVKATEGTTYTNPYFAGDWTGVAAVGLYRSAYHYARPALPVTTSATNQARYFVSVAGTQQGPHDLPPALDLEESGGLSPSDLAAWAAAWLAEVKRLTGRTPMVYTYPVFWHEAMADSTALSAYPLWIAHYTQDSAPQTVGGWTTWRFWQYTATGSLPGISGIVDLNRYCCTLANLASLTGTGDASAANPFGYYDNASVGTDSVTGAPTVRVRGWAIDPDTTDPVQVTVTVDGAVATTAAASLPSSDVAAVYPGFGSAHRFDITIPVAAGGGTRNVCVTAVNVGYGSANTDLGCKPATLPPTPPPAPGAPAALYVGPDQAVVGWTPPVGDGGAPVTDYEVSVAPAAQPAGQAQPSAALVLHVPPTGAGAPTQAVLPGLAPGTDYLVSVAASNVAGSGPASAPLVLHPEPAGSVATICPGGDPQPFTDAAADAHADTIACMAARHVVAGTTATTYDPYAPVTREQMASLLVNALHTVGVTLPAASGTSFADVPAGDVHADAINQLAATGIAKGTSATTFDPTATVTRAQMASFLARAYALAAPLALPTAAADPFTDVPSGLVQERDIAAVAAAGISLGATPTSFAPGAPVQRDQIASFLARTLNLVMQTRPATG